MSAANSEGEKKRMIGKYKIYETLGKGGYSWVKKGEDTETGAIVALKFMNRATDQWALEQAEQVRTEIKSLTQIRHEHVMKLYAYNLSAKYPLNDGGHVKTILLVLEYCPGGELFDILYYADKLEENIARTYFQQMCKGVSAVHTAGVAHRDLKPQNLLLDTKFNLKITDFGLSKIIETEEDRIMKTTYVGTRGYQAPELLKNQKYTNACDIFSMGVILFILLAGYPPFEAAHKTDKWYRPLATGHPEKFWHVHRGAKINDEAKKMIQGMLSYRPSKRMTLPEIMKSDWYNKDTVPSDKLKEKVLSRFMQARENRKKDVKKTKDLVDSNHKPEKNRRAVDASNGIAGLDLDYEKALDKKVAPKATKDIIDSMRTFYTSRNAMEAIQAMKTVLSTDLEMEVEHDAKTRPFELRCKCESKVGKDLPNVTFTFRVNAYTSKGSIYNMLHVKPISVPYRIGWHRVWTEIHKALGKYDILAHDGNPVPLIQLNDEGENEAKIEWEQPKMPKPDSADEDDSKEGYEANAADSKKAKKYEARLNAECLKELGEPAPAKEVGEPAPAKEVGEPAA